MKTVEDCRSLKICKQELCQQMATPSTLKAEYEKRLTKHLVMERRVQELYISLFTSKTIEPFEEGHREEEDILPILVSEVQAAAHSLKTGKAPGPDSITKEALKTDGDELRTVLTKLFNESLESKDIPIHWKKS